jgi:hypothetical protein
MSFRRGNAANAKLFKSIKEDARTEPRENTDKGNRSMYTLSAGASIQHSQNASKTHTTYLAYTPVLHPTRTRNSHNSKKSDTSTAVLLFCRSPPYPKLTHFSSPISQVPHPFFDPFAYYHIPAHKEELNRTDNWLRLPSELANAPKCSAT